MESSIPSFAWRGPRGSGKKTQLLNFLKKRSEKLGISFEIKYATWYLTKQTAGGDPDEDDDEATGKTIPYEESNIHMGFDVARMSMSDKVFLQSILQRWTGQQDVCLTGTALTTRYLVLYHAQHLTDESVLQLQEALEQYPNFSILLTTEIPICSRIRDYCFEIPVPGKDKLLENYSTTSGLSAKDVWKTFFTNTLEDWSTSIDSWDTSRNIELIVKIRNWIYICLQRNLRWSDVITYWIETIYETKWLGAEGRSCVLKVLSEAESGNGWVLVTSYRIPILWEHVHLQLAKELIKYRHKEDVSTDYASIITGSK